jgi:rod shape determining protein RodA
MQRLQHIIARFDWILLLVVLALCSIGLIVMYGIGISRGSTINLFSFQKQLVAILIGFSAIIGLILIDYRQLRSLALPIYAFGALILLGVLPFGQTVRGTRGWFVIGGISIQPVEIAKVCLVIFLASYLVRFVHERLPWHALFGSFVGVIGYAGLVLLQPDFGSAMVIFAIWAAMILFVGLPLRVIASFAMIALLIGGLVWSFGLDDIQKKRLTVFLNPAADVRGAGYNVRQAAIAIGSGGLFGKGVGEGSQARLRFLPEASTDFTFAVIGEELGFLGILFIFVMYGISFYRLYCIARDSEDDFASILIFGIGVILLIHILINAGMNMGVMPVTGVPLPFISGASSFLVAILVAIGLVESVSVHRRGEK